MPALYDTREIVWWRAFEGNRVLCRVTGQTEQYVRLRILWASPEQIIHTGHGIGDEANVDRRTGTIERIAKR